MATTKNPTPTAAGARRALDGSRITIRQVAKHDDAIRVFLNRDGDADPAACLLAARYPGARITVTARMVSINL